MAAAPNAQVVNDAVPRRRYWPVVLASTAVTQQMSCVVAAAAVPLHLQAGRTGPRQLLAACGVLLLLGGCAGGHTGGRRGGGCAQRVRLFRCRCDCAGAGAGPSTSLWEGQGCACKLCPMRVAPPQDTPRARCWADSCWAARWWVQARVGREGGREGGRALLHATAVGTDWGRGGRT